MHPICTIHHNKHGMSVNFAWKNTTSFLYVINSLFFPDLCTDFTRLKLVFNYY